jgi:ABC-type Fe3+ transport system permease subunit
VGRDFKAALVNTALYTGLSVAIILPLSVLLGLLVHQKRAGGVFLRTVLFSTYMVPMIAVALVWSKLYSPTEGTDQPDPRLGRYPAADLAVVAADGAGSRSCCSMSGSRSAISPSWWWPG